MADRDAMNEYKECFTKYLALSGSGLSAEQFYTQVTRDGVSKYFAYLMLRDLYGLNLAECMDVASRGPTDGTTERLNE